MHFAYCYWFQLAFSWLPLMGENPFLEPLEGVCPENQDFLGREMATAPPHTNTFTAATKFMYIKLPIYLFLYGAWTY